MTTDTPQIDWDDHNITIKDSGSKPVFEGCYAGITLTSGVSFKSDAIGLETAATPQGFHAISGGNAVFPELSWEFKVHPESLRISVQLRVKNTTSTILPIERLIVFASHSGYHNLPAQELELGYSGWQSFSPAAVRRPYSYTDPWVQPPVYAAVLPHATADTRTNAWMTVLGNQKDRCLAGFTQANNYQSAIVLAPGLEGHYVEANCYAEGVDLFPGETITSETLLLAWGESDELLLASYGDQISQAMGARLAAPPTGWGSWFYGFRNINEDGLMRIADAASEHQAVAPLDYIQVDDGYQAWIGDWLTPNERFPHGLDYLARHIRERGFKPGIWLAPFTVDARSELYAEHPDWVIHDAKGRPIDTNRHGDIYWPAPCYGLDTTHPAALQWLENVFRTMAEDWGYEYFKIDFLSAGAIPGQRYDAASTGIQAYRRGLDIIRKAVGESKLIGCGAPLLASVGYVDGMRINADLASELIYAENHDATRPGSRDPIASIIAKSWMNGRLWHNDPDYLRLDHEAAGLTAEELQTQTTLIALSGGSLLSSDDLTQLDQSDWEQLSRMLPAVSKSATPLHASPGSGRADNLRLVYRSSDQPAAVLGLFNWSDQPRSLTLQPESVGINGPYHLYNLWKGRYLGIFEGSVTVGQATANSSMLLSLRPAMSRPQLVGHTLHLLGDAVGTVEETWENGGLSLRLELPGYRQGSITFSLPSPYRLSQAALPLARIDGDRLILPVDFHDELELHIDFETTS